jgi:hypothetical protein
LLDVWFIEEIQDCWTFVFDEETVDFFIIQIVFAGDGSIPRTPLLGGNCFPQTPSMNRGVYMLDVRRCVLGERVESS